MVEVKKLWTLYDFCGPRATLCGDSRGRGSKTEDFSRFLQAARDPLRGSVEALSLWRRAILLLAKWPLDLVSWLARLLSQSRAPA